MQVKDIFPENKEFKEFGTYSMEGEGGRPAAKTLDVCLLAGFAKSKREARELIKSGGFYLNDIKTTDFNREISTDDFLYDKYLLLRKGKSNYFMLIFNNL